MDTIRPGLVRKEEHDQLSCQRQLLHLVILFIIYGLLSYCGPTYQQLFTGTCVGAYCSNSLVLTAGRVPNRQAGAYKR